MFVFLAHNSRMETETVLMLTWLSAQCHTSHTPFLLPWSNISWKHVEIKSKSYYLVTVSWCSQTMNQNTFLVTSKVNHLCSTNESNNKPICTWNQIWTKPQYCSTLNHLCFVHESTRLGSSHWGCNSCCISKFYI